MSPCRVGYTLQQLNTSQPISITVFLSIRIIPYIAKTEREMPPHGYLQKFIHVLTQKLHSGKSFLHKHSRLSVVPPMIL